jgi:Coenzyme PQQ synthesis protein D (PqqD)
MTVAPQYRLHNPKVIFETIEGETVIVDLGTGSYFSLVGAGSIVWTELTAGRSLDEILTRLNFEFDAVPREIEKAVSDLLQELVCEGLIIAVQTAAADPRSVESPPGHLDERPSSKRTFEPPRLQKFSDMQELLLLDPVHDVDSTGWPHAGDTSRA